jgi:glycosyltransferase involved in cell wall biosynthesis
MVMRISGMMPKITFVIPSSLNFNGGIERTVSRYWLYDTPDFTKIVLQGMHGVNGKNIYEIKSIYSRLITHTSGKINFAIRVMAPLILKIDRIINIDIIKKIEKDSQIIYLTNNDYYYLFRHARFLIWSEHGNIPSNYTGIKSLNAAIYALIKKHLLFRKINAMHLINCYNMDYSPFEKTFCVPNGVDSSIFYPAERSHKRIRVLFVGRLEKSKGVDKIFNVFKNNMENMDLTVVGSGTLEYLFAKPAKNINYIKNPEDKKLAEIYRDSDIFIFPSTLENFGNVVLEALSSGLYAIVSDTMKPRFDDIEKMNFLEYINSTEDGIFDALKNIESKLEYTGKYENRIAMHDFIAERYGWDIVLKRFYEELHNVGYEIY